MELRTLSEAGKKCPAGYWGKSNGQANAGLMKVLLTVTVTLREILKWSSIQ
jgi:hypothetical protein